MEGGGGASAVQQGSRSQVQPQAAQAQQQPQPGTGVPPSASSGVAVGSAATIPDNIRQVLQDVGRLDADAEIVKDLADKLEKNEVHKFKVSEGRFVLRKKRVPLTEGKKAVLEKAYLANHAPRGQHGRAARERLGEDLGLSYSQVVRWFINRRTKEKLLNRRMLELLEGSSATARPALTAHSA